MFKEYHITPRNSSGQQEQACHPERSGLIRVPQVREANLGLKLTWAFQTDAGAPGSRSGVPGERSLLAGVKKLTWVLYQQRSLRPGLIPTTPVSPVR